MNVKLQFFTAIASLALIGNAMAQSIAVSNPGVIKGNTAVVDLTYTAGAGATNLDFNLAYDETVIDENNVAFAIDCSGGAAIGLGLLTCSIDKTANENKAIGINFSPNPLVGGTFASVTLPTFGSAATGDYIQAANYNYSIGGVVTPEQTTWTLTVTDGPQPDWTSMPASTDPSPQIDFGTLNTDSAPSLLPLRVTNTGEAGSTLLGNCYMGPPQAPAGAPLATSGFSISGDPTLGTGLPTDGTFVDIMVQFDPSVAAIGPNQDMLTCEHNGSPAPDSNADGVASEGSPVTYDLFAHVMGYQVIDPFTATPPSPGVVDGASTLAATGGGSLNDVVFGSTTPTVCTVSAAGAVAYLIGGTCTATADQAGNVDYHAAIQVTMDITVNKLTQTITNFDTPTAGVVDEDGTLAATSDSSLDVTYASSTPAVCTLSGSTVSYLTAGTCNLTADQAGDDRYDPAVQVPLAITVAKADQDITNLAAAPSPGKVGTTSTLSSTVSSGLTPTYGTTTGAVCSVAGTTVTYLTVGTCTITADQAGDDNYNPALQVTTGVTVDPGDQAITGFFADPESGGVDDSSSLFATAGASSSPVLFGSLTPDICSVSGNVVTYLETGLCIVTANQAADANYNAAPQVTLDITVSDATAIPTLSQWGLISLFLIMLSLGGIVIRRREMLN